MVQQINLYNWIGSGTGAGTVNGIGFEDGFSGRAGQSIRVNAGASGFEYYTPGTGDLTEITVTSPVIVSSGTGPVPNVSLAGLNAVGTSGQFVTSTGTGWQYETATGATGSPVRSGSPTFTGTVTMSNLTATGSAIVLGAVSGGSLTFGNATSEIGFFGAEPVAQPSFGTLSETCPNPATDTANNIAYVESLASAINDLIGGLADLGLVEQTA